MYTFEDLEELRNKGDVAVSDIGVIYQCFRKYYEGQVQGITLTAEQKLELKNAAYAAYNSITAKVNDIKAKALAMYNSIGA